jgi:hypothetical protein
MKYGKAENKLPRDKTPGTRHHTWQENKKNNPESMPRENP